MLTENQLTYIGTVARQLRREPMDFFDLVLMMAHQELNNLKFDLRRKADLECAHRRPPRQPQMQSTSCEWR
jgi:protein-tyrosine-phosphatase